MRPVRVARNAVGYTPWIPLDYIESWFGATLAVVPSEDAVASATYTVQFCIDQLNLYPNRPENNGVQVTRAGTVATVFDSGVWGIGHGLVTGDSVIIRGTGSPYLDSPVGNLSPSNNSLVLTDANAYGAGDIGWQVASTPSPTTFTYTVQNAGPAADQGVTTISRLTPFNHATLVNATGRQNGTLNYPVRAVRLYVSALAAGFVQMQILQGTSA